VAFAIQAPRRPPVEQAKSRHRRPLHRSSRRGDRSRARDRSRRLRDENRSPDKGQDAGQAKVKLLLEGPAAACVNRLREGGRFGELFGRACAAGLIEGACKTAAGGCSTGKKERQTAAALEKEGINHNDFIIRQLPDITPEGELRKAFVDVKDFSLSAPEQDELNQGKKKVTAQFFLPKGSYATMVVRAVVED